MKTGRITINLESEENKVYYKLIDVFEMYFPMANRIANTGIENPDIPNAKQDLAYPIQKAYITFKKGDEHITFMLIGETSSRSLKNKPKEIEL